MAEQTYDMLVCSTCEGRLQGRTCVNGHNAYPGKRIKVAKVQDGWGESAAAPAPSGSRPEHEETGTPV